MRKKEDKQTTSEESTSFKCQFLPLVILNTSLHPLPLSLLQLVLDILNFIQLLKFVVDYNTTTWLGNPTTVFAYLDLTHYLISFSHNQQESIIIAAIVLMNVYFLTQFILFALKVEYTYEMKYARKVMFLVWRHLLLLPFFRILVGLYTKCSPDNPLSLCIPNIPLIKQILYILSLLILCTLLALQTYFNFEFLPQKKNYTRLRKSSHTPLAFFLYFMICELAVTILTGTAQLIALSILTLLLIAFVIWKDQQVEEIAKLIEYASLTVIMTGFLVLDAISITGCQVRLYAYLLLAAALFLGVMQLRTYSIKFQLENINKWPTQDIMIRQSSTIRYYLYRGQEFLFKVMIHGYMEIHRQKCDSTTCPSRCALSERDAEALRITEQPKKNQQLIRINNIMKVIYSAGYRLNPIPPEIQLEYCQYLYQKNDLDLALRKLLIIDESELTFEKYYVFDYLKHLISREIKNRSGDDFLDLVTEMALEKQDDQISKKFQKAALLNLEFWSLLNDDHPDFQKLNEVATERIRISDDINAQFQRITSYAHSQKITTQYANYLECIQNDQLLHSDIYQSLVKEYKLDTQILVQDWANSSINVMLVSLQQTTQGKIVEVNTTCAALFGFEKHQLINQHISNLYPEDIKKHAKQLMNLDNNQEHFLVSHKSGYLFVVEKNAKHYSSIATGTTALLTFEPYLTPNSCQLIIDKTNKIIGSSVSLISLLGIDLKSFEGESYSYQFFNRNLSEVHPKEHFNLEELLKADFLSDPLKKDNKDLTFSITVQQHHNCKLIDISTNRSNNYKNISKLLKQHPESNFQFQIEASPSEFKYIGRKDNEQSFVSQFSKVTISNSLQKDESRINYAQNIATLRLKDNAIQYIEEAEAATGSEQFVKHEEQSTHALVALPRKDQEEIFNSKKSYQNFLDKHKIGSAALPLLVTTVAVVFAFYITNFVVQNSNTNTAERLADETVYQNLAIAAIAHQARYIHELQLIAGNMSVTPPAKLMEQFNSNLAFLQNIELLGSTPFPITVTVSGSSSTYLTSQYISTLINYATALSSALSQVTTPLQLSTALNNIDPYALNYLLSGNQTKTILKSAFDSRQQQIVSQIHSQTTLQIVFLVIGILLIIGIGITMFIGLHKLNKQKVKVFEVFLEISEPQIQQFSSKTQRFLVSLQSQQANADNEQQTTHKSSYSSFAKKKSFKLIKTNRLFLTKLSLVLLVMTLFFAHIYSISSNNTQFQANSIRYMTLTADIDLYLANTVDALAINVFYNTTLDTANLAETLRLHYREYANQNELSFGLIESFEQIYQAVRMGNICTGAYTSSGIIVIPSSCQLEEISSNGTMLFLTDLITAIYQWAPDQFMEFDHHLEFQILSEAQRLICNKLLEAENNLIQDVKSSLLLALLLWMGISSAAALFIWGRQIGNFLRQLNEIKSILGILPLKIVKHSPLALKYLKETLQSNADTF